MAAGNPVQGMMARQLVERLAKSGGQQGASPDAAGEQLGAQFSQLQGADPQMLLKAAQQVKSMLVAIDVRTAFAVPEASRHAGQARKSIDAMIKALEQGAATQQTVRPIANQAAMPNPQQNPGGGEPMPAPDMGAM